MTPLGFLLDGHTPTWWVTAVLKSNPGVRISRIGAAGQPPLGATDPKLLRHCEEEKLVLVTCDRRTMYSHIADHAASGGIFYGMLLIDGPISTDGLVTDLLLIHATHTADDFIDTVMTLPL